MTNLVDNAYQYTPEGGKITLAVYLEDASVVFSVSDTGIGISKKYADRIFDRFFRNDEHPLVMETPGTGLGLAIVKELVDMQGGRIWFDSEEGRGTTFFRDAGCGRLVARDGGPGRMRWVLALNRTGCDLPRAHSSGVMMARILIAEDERDIRDLVEFTLKFAGHEVFKAANGAEAVELAPASSRI
jgi:hypothetical protein